MCYKESPSTIYSTKIVSLSELFLRKDDESQNYVIPEYQRPYAWEEKHWEDLWNDLQRAYSKKGEYLLGSVYLNENGEVLINSPSLSSKVERTDYTGEKIASLINQTADTVQINAKHINLNVFCILK